MDTMKGQSVELGEEYSIQKSPLLSYSLEDFIGPQTVNKIYPVLTKKL